MKGLSCEWNFSAVNFQHFSPPRLYCIDLGEWRLFILGLDSEWYFSAANYSRFQNTETFHKVLREWRLFIFHIWTHFSSRFSIIIQRFPHIFELLFDLKEWNTVFRLFVFCCSSQHNLKAWQSWRLLPKIWPFLTNKRWLEWKFKIKTPSHKFSSKFVTLRQDFDI